MAPRFTLVCPLAQIGRNHERGLPVRADISAYLSNEKMRRQSFCILITPQPSFFA
jgi:hypothetical protein